MKIWIDITNTPHVHFFIPIIRYLEQNHDIFVTARDFSETIPLLIKKGIPYTLIGDHKGKSKFKKVIGLLLRIFELIRKVPYFDLSISIGGQNTTVVSYFRNKNSIVFTDNDTSYKYHSYKLGSFFIFPSYFNYESVIKKYGVKREQIFLYDGFKEDIYIADYEPNHQFLNEIPFKEFITIRPENLKASYVPTDCVSIVPALFERFKSSNILFLPRYEEEKEYAKGYDNIFIPNHPLNGLDVCYFTSVMLTGAGTFAREAAIIGTPAVSFFPGKVFLTVDKIMQERGWQFKSRNVHEIYNFVQNVKKAVSRNDNSKLALNNVINIIDSIICEITLK